MLVRVTGLIILADLYAYMHEVEGYSFPAVVTACAALGIVDIILERVFK
jgi:hypothetical protein